MNKTKTRAELADLIENFEGVWPGIGVEDSRFYETTRQAKDKALECLDIAASIGYLPTNIYNWYEGITLEWRSPEQKLLEGDIEVYNDGDEPVTCIYGVDVSGFIIEEDYTSLFRAILRLYMWTEEGIVT